MPPPILGSTDAEQRGAVDAAAELLRGLGHEVVERDPDYGAEGPAFTARYFRGIHDEGRAMAHPERLSRRTRGFMRLGSALRRCVCHCHRTRCSCVVSVYSEKTVQDARRCSLPVW